MAYLNVNFTNYYGSHTTLILKPPWKAYNLPPNIPTFAEYKQLLVGTVNSYKHRNLFGDRAVEVENICDVVEGSDITSLQFKFIELFVEIWK